MGASLSQPESDSYVSEKLDYIATYYILTSDFKSLKNLYKKEYCDDLVILTSDIIQKNLSYQDVSYLQRRIINGEPINQMNREPMIWFSNASIKKDIDKSITNEKNKARMCMGIAKFYIKIAHVFAAIITSINPMYSYIEDGEEKQLGNDRTNIPDVELKFKLGGLCESRIDALSSGYDYINVKTDVDIGLNVCSSEPKLLIEEPGIPELEKLYYDEYDYKEGRFYGMSDKSRKLYEEDVKAFYETIMDTRVVPESIKKFSDIKLRDFANSQECQNSDSVFNKKFKDSAKNALFVDYINNIKKMRDNSENFQKEILIQINKIFVYTLDVSGDKLVRIDPLLTMTTLEEIIIDVRKLLITMYLKCEDNFNDGVKIFRSIADTMTVDRLRSEIQELEKADNIQEYLNNKYPEVSPEIKTPRPEEILEKHVEFNEPLSVPEEVQPDGIKPAEPVPNQFERHTDPLPEYIEPREPDYVPHVPEPQLLGEPLPEYTEPREPLPEPVAHVPEYIKPSEHVPEPQLLGEPLPEYTEPREPVPEPDAHVPEYIKPREPLPEPQMPNEPKHIQFESRIEPREPLPESQPIKHSEPVPYVPEYIKPSEPIQLEPREPEYIKPSEPVPEQVEPREPVDQNASLEKAPTVPSSEIEPSENSQTKSGYFVNLNEMIKKYL